MSESPAGVEALFADPRVGVALVSLDGRFLRASARFCEVLGYSAEELRDIRWQEVTHPADLRPDVALADKLRHGDISDYWLPKRYLRKDGTPLPVLMRRSAPPDGADLPYFVVEIEESVGAPRVVEPSWVEALSNPAKRPRRDCMAIVAHELRQPASVIQIFAQLLAKRLGDAPELAHIAAASRRLERMVADLSDASAIGLDQLRLRLAEHDVAALVADCVERCTATHADLAARVVAHGALPPVRVDAVRIEQVLENLLLNAYKYGAPGAEITVTLAAVDEEVEVSVTNRGVGITPSDLPRIFEPFVRGDDARASATPGLGVGLYVVRGLVEAHGGRVRVESTPSQTTTFTFTLKTAAAADANEVHSSCG